VLSLSTKTSQKEHFATSRESRGAWAKFSNRYMKKDFTIFLANQIATHHPVQRMGIGTNWFKFTIGLNSNQTRVRS
jgi:hypothetical protein